MSKKIQFQIGTNKKEVKEYLNKLVDLVYQEGKVIIFGLRGSSNKSHSYHANNGLVDFQCMVTDDFFNVKGSVIPIEDSGILPLIFTPKKHLDSKWLKEVDKNES